jgi:ribose transport system substrate-binding protein
MKKLSRVVAFLLTAAMAASAAGCSSGQSTSSAAAPAASADTQSAAVSAAAPASQAASTAATSTKYKKTEYNLVFIPKLVHEWYEDVKVGIDKACAELKTQGITVKYTWDAPPQAVVTDQMARLESEAAKKPDAIAVAVIDASATNSVIDELVGSGVHVTTFDCDAPTSKREYYCGHSTNADDGKQMADKLATAIGGSGNIAICAGTLSAGNHQERVKGFTDEIKAKYPNIKIVDSKADNDSIETALSVTEGYLSTYKDLKAVYCVNAASPIGAARAIKEANKAGKVLIFGFAENQEAMKYVKDGTITCTLKQQVQQYGYNSVFNMLQLADGNKPTKVQDDLPAVFVTKDNVDQYLK